MGGLTFSLNTKAFFQHSKWLENVFVKTDDITVITLDCESSASAHSSVLKKLDSPNLVDLL